MVIPFARGKASLVWVRVSALGWGCLAIIWALMCVLVAVIQPEAPLSGLAWLEEPRGSSGQLLWPIERNAHRRLPSVSAALGAIHMQADGVHGWAVGSYGLVIATADGGKSWTGQNSSTKESLQSVQFLNDGLRGWATGSSGVVIATTNGGKSWQVQNSSTKEPLYSVQFLNDGLHGWAVGSNGVVIATVNGGASWALQNSGTTTDLRSAQFLNDGVHGWAVGSGGLVITTTDGGYSWAAQKSGTTEELRSVHFLNDGVHGWGAGWNGVMIATANGGKSWTAQDTRTKGYLHSVQFLNDGVHGWAVGGDGIVIATTDGGKTWAAQIARTIGRLHSLQFLDDGRRGWALNDNGVIFATVDGGKTWAAQTRPSAALYSVQFLDKGLRGWAVGSQGVVIVTADGGRTWTAQASNTIVLLHSVQLLSDGMHGWAVGDMGTVIVTGDGGKTWTAQNTTTTDSLRCVFFLADGRRGWIVGVNGIVLATTDGGESWTTQKSGIFWHFSSVQFHGDGLRGWVAGEKGVVTTTDGGKTWVPQARPADYLWSLQFLHDGLHGWAVGNDGVVATDDGGKTWTVQYGINMVNLQSVQFLDDGLHGWAVGANGLVIATVDGGKNWSTQKSGTTKFLRAVRFRADGLRGWAAGQEDEVIATTDGGKTWSGAWAPYRRYPAPWFWIALLPSLGFVVLAWRSNAMYDEKSSVADVAASDAAVQNFADDRLDFAPLARGISRFLRNEETKAPLTLAITGDWGSGKTSLMQLTCADLRHFSYRPIWFNAWHHQKEEHLFAALLGAVRKQVAPPTWHLSGMAFRLRLLWLRSKKHWFWAMVFTIVATALATWLWNHDVAQWDILWKQLLNFNDLLGDFGKPTKVVKDKALNWPPLLASLGSGLAVFLGLRKGLTAIGADPATLLTGTANYMKLKDASEHNVFRMKFAEQFNEVAEALHGRMVIFIDDLDRCKSEAVLEILEAVNFLTTAGDCFVIFGMAPERVQAALGIAFERIAKELIEEEASVADNEIAALKSRRAFARDYLQKLVNVEIKVPARNDISAYRLLIQETHRPVAYRKLRNRVRALTGMVPVVALICAAVAGIATGLLFELEPPPSPAPVAVTRAAIAPAKLDTSVLPLPPVFNSVPISAPPQAPASVELHQGEKSWAQWFWIAIPLAGLGLALSLLLLYRLRQTVVQVKDSPDFRQALEIWTELVALHRNTPRAVKRFGNRIRYFAMLQQGAAEDRSFGEQVAEHLSARWAGYWKKSEPLVEGARSAAITEALLIALGALQEVWGADWRQAVFADSQSTALAVKAIELKRVHCQRFHVNWPPSEEELRVFERLLAGIRLPGDTEVAQPTPATVDDLTQSSTSTSQASSSSVTV